MDFNISTSRFIDVGVYGYLMINIIFAAAAIFKQEVSKSVVSKTSTGNGLKKYSK